MSPKLSHRLALTMQRPHEPQEQVRIVNAARLVNEFEELPADIQALVLAIEARAPQ